MAKNFTEASAVVEDLIDKKDNILSKIANEISEAVIGRMRDGKTNIENDIQNLIKKLPVEDQRTVLLYVVSNMAKGLNISSRGEQRNNGSGKRNDIFAGRR